MKSLEETQSRKWTILHPRMILRVRVIDWLGSTTKGRTWKAPGYCTLPCPLPSCPADTPDSTIMLVACRQRQGSMLSLVDNGTSWPQYSYSAGSSSVSLSGSLEGLCGPESAGSYHHLEFLLFFFSKIRPCYISLAVLRLSWQLMLVFYMKQFSHLNLSSVAIIVGLYLGRSRHIEILLFLFNFVCVWVSLCMPPLCRYLWRAEEGAFGSPVTRNVN